MLCLGTAPCANALAVERLSALPNAQCKIARIPAAASWLL